MSNLLSFYFTLVGCSLVSCFWFRFGFCLVGAKSECFVLQVMMHVFFVFHFKTIFEYLYSLPTFIFCILLILSVALHVSLAVYHVSFIPLSLAFLIKCLGFLCFFYSIKGVLSFLAFLPVSQLAKQIQNLKDQVNSL